MTKAKKATKKVEHTNLTPFSGVVTYLALPRLIESSRPCPTHGILYSMLGISGEIPHSKIQREIRP
jgi:hypothetical protein